MCDIASLSLPSIQTSLYNRETKTALYKQEGECVVCEFPFLYGLAGNLMQIQIHTFHSQKASEVN
jgi:hypothetical protein